MDEGATYGLGALTGGERIPAPKLDYLPRDPRSYAPKIGLIGCGGSSERHLAAYRRAGYRVSALCDLDRARAEARRDELFPQAEVFVRHEALLGTDVEVVDVATHADVRPAIVADCLRAGRHVLSQKPFALDLDEGRRLVALAERQGVRLAVNQNGRWAPHLAYARRAVEAGLLGELACVDVVIHWDHGWTAGTPFDELEHLLLFDFGVHWFDLFHALFGEREPRRVTASVARTRAQRNRQPLLAQALVEYDGGRATLTLHGDSPHFQRDTTLVAGARGTLLASGPDLQHQEVELFDANGAARPALEGDWFTNGFHGTMAELLCAIEEDREPENSARGNLASLALCFAACASSRSGKAESPSDARRP